MKIALELTTKPVELERYIISTLNDIVQKKTRKILAESKRIIKDTLREAIMNQPEYTALTTLGGRHSLQALFGFDDGESRMKTIINKLLSGVTGNVSFGQSRKLISVDMILGQLDIEELYDLRVAKTNLGGGDSLPWLEWLLTRGTDVLITDYKILFGAFPESRSGMAVMRSAPGQLFSIPSQFAGTENDNFITRAIEEAMPEIQQVLETTIKDIFKNA